MHQRQIGGREHETHNLRLRIYCLLLSYCQASFDVHIAWVMALASVKIGTHVSGHAC